MSLTMIDPSRNRARNVLQAMPDELYAALPCPERTASGAVEIVDKALRSKNPDCVREWIHHEHGVPNPASTMAVLNLAIERVKRGITDQRRLRLLAHVQQSAKGFIGETQLDEELRHEQLAFQAVRGIKLAIRAYDPALIVHSEAVARLAKRFAQHVSLDSEATGRITLASEIHELGRLRVSRERLDRPVAFDRDELLAIRAELSAGAAELRDDAELAETAPLLEALYDDVTSSSVSVESQVISISDAFHVMTLPRPYRAAMDVHGALNELRSSAGHRFDSALVEEFLDLMQSRSQAKTA